MAAALLKDDLNINNMLCVLDGDKFNTVEQKKEMMAKVLTGDTQRLTQKRNKAINYIRQFLMPNSLKPEQYLHGLITKLPEQQNEEYNEIIRAAKDIVVANDSHKYIDDIIERMDFERAAGLKVITDLISRSADWQNYTLEITKWLLSRKEGILET